MSPARRAVLLTLLCSSLSAAASGAALAQETSRARVTDLVLITIDALRADHLGAYGYHRPITPNLDALAYRSLRFERVYTPTPHTSLAIGSLLTGRALYSSIRLQPERTYQTLPELLRGAGFATAAFFPPAVFFTENQRFKRYEDTHFGFEHAEIDYFDSKLGVERTIAYLERRREKRSFVWLHLLEPHEPYDQHPSHFFGHGDKDRYDSEIAFADAAVGHLLDYLARTRPGAAILVTADHGEAFDEHGARYHGTSLYDEQLRVPLILHLPGTQPRVIHAPISLLDVAPTFLQLGDVAVPAELRGQPLTAQADTKLRDRPVFSEFDELRMVVSGTRKLLCNIVKSSCAVYELSKDPRELHDILSSAQDTVASLMPELMRRISEAAASYAQKVDPKEPRWSLIGRAQLGDGSVAAELSGLLGSGVPQPLRDRKSVV